MKTINSKILLFVTFLLIIILDLIANIPEQEKLISPVIDTSSVEQLYQNITGTESQERLDQIFELADSLLCNDMPDQSLYVLKKALQESLFSQYLLQRDIKFKIYDLYSYQWDFSKSIPEIRDIYKLDSLNYNKGMMANSSLWVASTYTDNNDYEKAMSWIKKSRSYATEVDSTRILAYLHMLEGDIFATKQDLHSAFEKYQRAEKYIDQFPISNTSALIYLSLASIYLSLEQNDIAIKYYQKTTDIYNKLEDYSGAALAIYNLAIAYGNSGDNEKALQYALESIEVCKQEENKYAVADMLASCYALTSQLYERQEEWDLSLKYLILSDELIQANTSDDATLENYNQYIRFYTKLGDYENALHYVQLGDSLKSFTHIPFLEGDFLNARLEFYQTFGMNDKAVSIARKMISNIRKETSDEVANLVAEFEAQKNLDKVTLEKQHLDLLNAQKSLTIANQKSTILIIIVLILIILIATIFLYYRYKSKVKLAEILNNKVDERTKELRLANEKLLAEIADHKATTHQLIYAQRLTGVGEIASGLAHEIRNPLTNIIASIQILKAKHNIYDDEFADIILRNAQNANVRVKELLNYSQPIEFKIETISLNRVILEVINLIRGKLLKEDIKLKYSPGSKQDLVSIDKKQINTVFLNFILNSIDAIKLTSKKGLINISTYDEFNFVVVEFKDNGCGIEENILPKIFQPFFTDKKEGTGIGLNLAHKIIHQHGGIISVKSEVGVYTTITVKLLNIKS